MSRFFAASTKPRSISTSARSSAPSAVIPGRGWSLFAITHSHFQDLSACLVSTAIQCPVAFSAASAPSFGVMVSAYAPVGNREVASHAHVDSGPLRVHVEVVEEGLVHLRDGVPARERRHVRLEEDRLVGQHRLAAPRGLWCWRR